MRIRYWIPALAAVAALSGCVIGTPNEDADSLDWSWSIVDYGDPSIAYDCGDVGAEYTRLTIADADGVEHTFYWMCADSAGTWEADEENAEALIAGGNATVTAELLTSGDAVLSTGTFEFEFDGIINDLGAVEFAVDMWDPEAEADASIWWQWQLADECIPFEDTVDGDWPTEAECAAAGIDYVNLWIWNPVVEQWWTDSTWTEFPCGAFDQDDGYFYSGLWLPEFLQAGTYQFFLGFYQEAAYNEGGDTTDVLLYYDTRGTSDDPHNGQIFPDDEVGGYNDLGCTALDTAAYDMGVLKVNLQWGQSQGGVFDSCFDSNVGIMGFLLRNDGWVAAEVPLSDGVECLDWLVFEEVPILVDPYELLVSGISDANEFLWYNLCTGLDPEPGTVDDVTGYTCEIVNQLSQ
jgi:hypothetical protein